jgi:hypothetical protein
MPRHVARLFSRLVVDYFIYVARPVASARRVACHVTHHRLLRLAQARRRLLRLHRASGCLGTSRDTSRDSSSTTSPRAGLSSTTSPRAGSSSITSPTPRVQVPRHVPRLVTRLVIDYFAYAARSGASARPAARHAACHRLLRLRRASGCLGTSRGSSRGSSLTISHTPRVRVLQHVARLIMGLIVDYSVRRDFVLQPHWLYLSHAVRHDYLSCGNTGSTSKSSISAMLTSLLPSEGFYDFSNKIPATSIRQKPFSKLSQVTHMRWLS